MRRPRRPIDSFDEAAIDLLLDKALKRLRRRDKILFENDASERSICHRLAIYLQIQFYDFDVDCEYNCDHNDEWLVKRLDNPQLLAFIRAHKPTFNGDSVTVFPDIIVHHRNTDENLLVIESKKTTSGVSDDYDIQKLLAYRRGCSFFEALQWS